MHSDGSHNGIALSIDNADITRTRINHVDFVFFAVSRESRRLSANPYGFRRLKCTQVNDGNGVALAIGDVGIFAVCRAVIGQGLLTEVPPSQGGGQRKQHHEEEEFSQNSFRN